LYRNMSIATCKKIIELWICESLQAEFTIRRIVIQDIFGSSMLHSNEKISSKCLWLDLVSKAARSNSYTLTEVLLITNTESLDSFMIRVYDCLIRVCMLIYVHTYLHLMC